MKQETKANDEKPTAREWLEKNDRPYPDMNTPGSLRAFVAELLEAYAAERTRPLEKQLTELADATEHLLAHTEMRGDANKFYAVGQAKLRVSETVRLLRRESR